METDLELVIKDTSLQLGPADVKSYMQMLLQGLQACHQAWVLHRDVKPNNFLIASSGALSVDHKATENMARMPTQHTVSLVLIRLNKTCTDK